MRYVIGADEVGLGPLAGDVFACAVLVAEGAIYPEGVTDSKALTPRKREALHRRLLATEGLHHSIARATPEEIDRDGVRPCHQRCFVEAIKGAVAQLPEGGVIAAVRVDGNPMDLPGLHLPIYVRFVVRGDASDPAIGAASIIAKVERDAYMASMAEEHPGYGWSRNAGYGTPEHIKGIKLRGLTPLHRKRFCRKFTPEPEDEIDVLALFGEG